MNVKQIVMSMLKNNSNPIFANLIKLAEENNTTELENFARNYYKEQGKDFEKEFKTFQEQLGINCKK